MLYAFWIFSRPKKDVRWLVLQKYAPDACPSFSSLGVYQFFTICFPSAKQSACAESYKAVKKLCFSRTNKTKYRVVSMLHRKCFDIYRKVYGYTKKMSKSHIIVVFGVTCHMHKLLPKDSWLYVCASRICPGCLPIFFFTWCVPVFYYLLPVSEAINLRWILQSAEKQMVLG